MARDSQYISISVLLEFMLTMCVLSLLAIGQAIPVQQQQPASKAAQQQPRPLSLQQMYGHFLIYQNHLDTKAAELTAQGKDGSALSDALQKKSGLSDADYAAVRISSSRLAAKLKDMDTQAATIRSSGSPLSPEQLDQLKGLLDQQTTAIDFEITYLKQNLSPVKITAFEDFLAQFFFPAKATTPPPFAVGKSAPGAVQK
jgi:hypothetical protein